MLSLHESLLAEVHLEGYLKRLPPGLQGLDLPKTILWQLAKIADLISAEDLCHLLVIYIRAHVSTVAPSKVEVITACEDSRPT